MVTPSQQLLALGKGVGSFLRYQPTPCTGEQRSAQDYTFEALHRVYFYDAWRVQPVLALSGRNQLPQWPVAHCFLFTVMKSGHPACPFITYKQLALYASPRFWQYGLLAFVARCCSFDNQHRHQEQPKQWKGSHKTKEKDPLCKLSSCPLLGEWSMASRRNPPMTSLSTSQYRSCLTWL